jgi:uncharacterized protein
MDNPLTRQSWSPYAVGAAIGVLSWFTFASSNKPLGITTAFENTAALAQKTAVPSVEQSNKYFAVKANEGKAPKIDWEWMLVVGVFVGALLSAWLAGDRHREKVPVLWRWRFGDSVAPRFTAAFAGGALMMFGARMASGCTSGHGISGALQLAVSSWVFIFLAFAVGIVTAFAMYGREGRSHV